MPKFKKKSVRPPAAKKSPYSAPSLAPQILEEAAQGWLQSSGSTPPPPRLAPPVSDHHLTEALAATLRELRSEISELRQRLHRLESR